MRVTIAAPAKVNLWLRVGPAEPSGFHPISTLFCALDLADTVTLRRASSPDESGLELDFAPPLDALPELGPDDSNLAVRAASAFMERSGGRAMPQIRLVKRIPAGGGLGGGSSDAGAVLRALHRMHPRAVDTDAILDVARELGSDVPFFVLGSPLAHGAGRGERLTALVPPPPRPVVLVLPPFPVATGEAYGWLDADRDTGILDRAPFDSSPDDPDGSRLTWERIAERASNDFEDPVFRRHPDLRDVRDALRAAGATLALLAGSGSAVFGVFAEHSDAEAAAGSVRNAFPDHRVLLTATRTR